MSNSTNSCARTLWRIGIVGIALWATPSCLRSQETSSSHRHSSADEIFAGVNGSLTRVADALLDTAALSASPATRTTNVVQTPTISVASLDGQVPQPWVEKGLTAAALRVNLLRCAVEPILRSHGVPADLAAVILVESGGRAAALSPKGARGLWQLMPDTARRYGLRVDEIQDDRLDLFRATDAAARYLHDLYAQFGDWRLALAAYNTGEANVGSAILRAHTQDFDQLTNLRMLPLETRNYVPRVLAAAQSTGQLSALTKTHDAPSATTVFAVPAAEARP
jgi:Transglycosylase SLT domain